ncbi:hypothetical protein KM043_013564 [Ampulex compressa]|nr:hypothetical protein KM043_013564 [Ampulex compressa]
MSFMLKTFVFKRGGQCVHNSRVFDRALSCLKCGDGSKALSSDYLLRRFSTKQEQDTRARVTKIYTGALKTQVRNIKLFSLITSLGGLASQPFLYLKAAESANLITIVGVSSVFGFFAIVSPLLLHLITKKYVTHIYYDAGKDKYIAKTYSLFVRPKELEFTPDDVVVPNVTGIFSSCVVKRIPLYIEQQCFDDPNHFVRIMGFDKPMDFKFGDVNGHRSAVVMEDSGAKKKVDK